MRLLLTIGRSIAPPSAMLGIVLLAGPISGQAANDAPIEVPLQVHGGRLFVPVEATDGSTLEFILSTGNAVTVFTESTAALVGDEPGLSMGGIPVATDEVTTIPDKQLVTDGRRFDGMIGATTLNEFDVLVDVPGHRMMVKPVGPRVDWPGVSLSAPVRLQVYHGVALGLEVELGGQPYRATLDLGTPSLVVNDAVQTALGLAREDVSALTLGDRNFPDLEVKALDLEVLRRWDPSGTGFVLVGAPIAYDCVIALSWIHREMRTCAP